MILIFKNKLHLIADKDIRCDARELIFDKVICRVRDDMALECHVDTDEANAALLKNGDKVEII